MNRETLHELLTWLDGKKTYIVSLLAILYLFGGDQGWWHVNECIMGMLGFGGLAALRAGVKKDTQDTP